MATTALAEIIPGWSVASDANTERLDTDLLARAYHFSDRAHAGQRRRNGDPFVTHCVEVAKILADLQLDSVTVATGLIHDVVEDTNVTLEDVEREHILRVMARAATLASVENAILPFVPGKVARAGHEVSTSPSVSGSRPNVKSGPNPPIRMS